MCFHIFRFPTFWLLLLWVAILNLLKMAQQEQSLNHGFPTVGGCSIAKIATISDSAKPSLGGYIYIYNYIVVYIYIMFIYIILNMCVYIYIYIPFISHLYPPILHGVGRTGASGSSKSSPASWSLASSASPQGRGENHR